jgi:hypothetical protein
MKATKEYKINKVVRQIKDAQSVRFHVESDDYFGTTATLIKLLQQYLKDSINKAPAEERELIEKTFKNIEADLLLLQNNYQIKAKKSQGKAELKGRLNNQ